MKNKIYTYLISNNVQIDQDVFDYGFSYFKKYIFYVFITIPFIIYFKLYLNVILFLVLFIPLRKYLGGYHFNNDVICILFSSFVSIAISYYSNICNISYLYYIFSTIAILLLSYFLAPVEHKNKELNSYEKKIYKFKAIKIEIIFLYYSVLTYIFSINTLINLLFYINIINIFNLIIGNLLNEKCQ